MDSHPNIILCTCDQLRAHAVGCYGSEVACTPNLDRLADEGFYFEHAISNNPVCMPSRSSLLTGQYSRTCQGFLGNYTETDHDGNVTMPEYPVEERNVLLDETLAEVLSRAGYQTAVIGKWHIHPSPTQLGFDFAVYPRVHHRHTGQTFIEQQGLGDVVEGYSVDYEAERVLSFLDDAGDQPLFLYYNISPPHMPLMDAPEKYLSMFSADEVPLRPNVFIDSQMAYDEDWFKIYLWDFLYYDHNLPYTEELPPGFDLRHLTALYYGMTAWVDDTVGQLLESLEKRGLRENTIIVFLSDHGDILGSHHLFNKGQLFEESIRIPMIFSGPGIPHGTVNSTQVAQIVDIMPTLLDLCGVEIPASAQGRSLKEMLFGNIASLPQTHGFVETYLGQIGVRTPQYLFGLSLQDDLQTLDTSQKCLYDLEQDPYQLENLSGELAYYAIEEQLNHHLIKWHHETPRLVP